MARRLDGQHDAPLVVLRPGTNGRGRQEDGQGDVAAEVPMVPLGDRPDGDVPGADAVEQGHGARVRLALEAGGHEHGADREAVEEVRESVIVIHIGMREDHGIEPRHAPGPERRRDQAAAGAGVAHPAGIIEEGAAVARADHHGEAMPHGQDFRLGPHRLRREERQDQEGRGAGEERRPRRSPDGPSPLVEHRDRRQGERPIGDRHPRLGWTRPEPVSPAPVGASADEAVRRGEQPPAGPGRGQAERRPNGREPQRQPRREHGQRGERDQGQIEDDADGRDDVESPRDQRPRREPDDQGDEQRLADPPPAEPPEPLPPRGPVLAAQRRRRAGRARGKVGGPLPGRPRRSRRRRGTRADSRRRTGPSGRAGGSQGRPLRAGSRAESPAVEGERAQTARVIASDRATEGIQADEPRIRGRGEHHRHQRR